MDTTSRDEAPSDDHLREYLEANMRRSAIAWHYPDSDFRPDLVDPGFVASLRAFEVVGGGLFLDCVVDALFEALRRLNALPRTDELWSGTNGRPTLFKLRDHVACTLRAAPGDTAALWAQAGLHLVHGSSNFGAKYWRRLHHEGDADVRWPVLAALLTELNASPTGNELVELLDRTERQAEACAFLSSFDACGDPWVLRWRDDIVAGLDARQT